MYGWLVSCSNSESKDRVMCLAVLKHREKFTDADCSGLNDINKRRRDAFRGCKILSKV